MLPSNKYPSSSKRQVQSHQPSRIQLNSPMNSEFLGNKDNFQNQKVSNQNQIQLHNNKENFQQTKNDPKSTIRDQKLTQSKPQVDLRSLKISDIQKVSLDSSSWAGDMTLQDIIKRKTIDSKSKSLSNNTMDQFQPEKYEHNTKSEDNRTFPVDEKTSSRYFLRNLKLFVIFVLISIISIMLLSGGTTIIGKVTEENDFERQNKINSNSIVAQEFVEQIKFQLKQSIIKSKLNFRNEFQSTQPEIFNVIWPIVCEMVGADPKFTETVLSDGIYWIYNREIFQEL